MELPSRLPDVEALTAAHNARLAALDPDLGPVAVPDLDTARGVLAAGDAVGVWTHHEVTDSDLGSLWGGLSQDVLAVRSPRPVARDLGDLLDELDRVRGPLRNDADAEVVVRLPALEAGVATVLLARGLRPASQTALLRLGPDAVAAGSEIAGTRPATSEDVDAVTALLHEMHESDVAWGSGFRRPSMPIHLRRLAEEACAREGRTWVALEGGSPIGVASLEGPDEAAWATSGTSVQPAFYLGLMAVTVDSRGKGTGRRLAAHAHSAAAASGGRGVVLDHAALSPLSSTFWHRRGYRPLWTTWVRRG